MVYILFLFITDPNAVSSLGMGSEDVSIVIIQQGLEGEDIVLQTDGGQVLASTLDTTQTDGGQVLASTLDTTQTDGGQILASTLDTTQTANPPQEQTVTEEAEKGEESLIQNPPEDKTENSEEVNCNTEPETGGGDAGETGTEGAGEDVSVQQEDKGENSVAWEWEKESQTENAQVESDVKSGQKLRTVYLNKKPRRAGKKNNVVMVYSCGICVKKFSSKGIYYKCPIVIVVVEYICFILYTNACTHM
jgi:hypothetical protein